MWYWLVELVFGYETCQLLYVFLNMAKFNLRHCKPLNPKSLSLLDNISLAHLGQWDQRESDWVSRRVDDMSVQTRELWRVFPAQGFQPGTSLLSNSLRTSLRSDSCSSDCWMSLKNFKSTLAIMTKRTRSCRKSPIYSFSDDPGIANGSSLSRHDLAILLVVAVAAAAAADSSSSWLIVSL